MLGAFTALCGAIMLCNKMSTKTNKLSPDVFFQAQNAPKPIFGWGSTPDPAGGAYDAPPDPLVGWGGGNPLPFDVFGVSISAPAAPRLLAPSEINSCLRHWLELDLGLGLGSGLGCG